MEKEGTTKEHENYFNYTDDQLMEKNFTLKNMHWIYIQLYQLSIERWCTICVKIAHLKN